MGATIMMVMGEMRDVTGKIHVINLCPEINSKTSNSEKKVPLSIVKLLYGSWDRLDPFWTIRNNEDGGDLSQTTLSSHDLINRTSFKGSVKYSSLYCLSGSLHFRL